jgi:hypothetical protein
MTRLVVAVVLVGAAALVAWWMRRRQATAAPTQTSFEAPTQLDRRDFAGPDRPWLVAVFTSATCGTCAAMAAKAQVLASRDVAVQEVEVAASPGLHQRYAIAAVPITVLADRAGVVRASFVGPATATDLWAAVAEARQPGSSPEPELGRG